MHKLCSTCICLIFILMIVPPCLISHCNVYRRYANYREPGRSGYIINNDGTTSPADMQKHLNTCVNITSGGDLPCEMKVGGKYIDCLACTIVKCANEISQRDCSSILRKEKRQECETNIKWCESYEIKEVEEGSTRRGYVPRSTNCINSNGVPSQTLGEIAKKGTDILGNCYYTDEMTLVRRNITGNFAYCGEDNPPPCNPFHGAYRSLDYDPRWRGWYIATKDLQAPNWSPPYPFFSSQEIGITFSLPIYTMLDDGRNFFDGVLAVDYEFTDVGRFLRSNYQNTSTTVAIFEQDDPHYIVATSTGEGSGVKLVLKDDENVPCPTKRNADHTFDCKAVRVETADVDSEIIRAAFIEQKKNGFKTESLIASEGGDGTVFASLIKPFSIAGGADLKWNALIMSPVETESSDTLVKGDTLFGAVIATAAFGFAFCGLLFVAMISNRRKREFVTSDWRFMGAFIVCCALLNLSCLSFLGPNTNSLCLLRMWLVHFFFVATLSMLFVKTYRMYRLVGQTHLRRMTMSHGKTAQLAIPFILLQTVILLIFTFVDPSRSVDIVEASGSDLTHRLICAHDTPAFFITMMIYEGGLILLGCVLAFKTRNLRSEFNESRQIILSMYDTAVISTILLVVSNTAISYQGEQRLLFTLGIFWTTCFACSIFVLPLIMAIRSPGDRTSTRISGVSENVVTVASIRLKAGDRLVSESALSCSHFDSSDREGSHSHLEHNGDHSHVDRDSSHSHVGSSQMRSVPELPAYLEQSAHSVLRENEDNGDGAEDQVSNVEGDNKHGSDEDFRDNKRGSNEEDRGVDGENGDEDYTNFLAFVGKKENEVHSKTGES